MIRVLLVEDSITQREILRRLLRQDTKFRIVGEATTGYQAVELAQRLQPDVVLMDIHMPELDGVAATRLIMQRSPVPIVVASATLQSDEVDLGLEALKAGAVSVIQKPQGAVLLHLDKIAPDLQRELVAASKARVIRRTVPPTSPVGLLPQPTLQWDQIEVVAMCASTGGPPVLAEIFSRIPCPYPLPILLVQHISEGFVTGFARWLRQLTGQPVGMAEPWQRLSPGIWLSPDRKHLSLADRNRLQLIAPSGEIHCPSGDVLFRSVATHVGPAGLGIVLTGMGDDGAEGLLALRQAGGRTVIQDEASSLIFGMPKSARDRHAAELELPPDGIIQVLTEVARHASASRPAPWAR